MQDLKQRTVRGGVARLCAQAATFVLRLGSLMVLARLLGPNDFGLVGMVTAFTGVLSLLRDFGLSAAAVQHATVTEEQSSTLFWLNVLAGILLALLATVCAPAIAAFYHDPRLIPVTAVLSLGAPPAPNALHSAGDDRGCFLGHQYSHCHRRGIGRLRILVARSDDRLSSTYSYDRFLPYDEMGTGKAARAGEDSFHDALRRSPHIERLDSVCGI
jgi:Polysaccharide biosynthesis protein